MTKRSTCRRLESGCSLSAFRDYINKICSDDTVKSDVEANCVQQIFNIFDKNGDGQLDAVESAKFNETIVDRVNKMRTALLVVDFQNDFIDGELGLKNGEAKHDPMDALPLINALLKRSNDFDFVAYTLDWHPENHISFYECSRDDDRVLAEADRKRVLKPFTTVHFLKPSYEQTLYPAHCIRDTWGAALHDGLERVENAHYVRKGTDVHVDAYSAYMDNKGAIATHLHELLQKSRIDAVFVCGLALDICVYSTARDAAKLGYLSSIIADCSRGLDSKQIEKTRLELVDRNVPYINSDHVKRFIERRHIPLFWILELAKSSNKAPPTKRVGVSRWAAAAGAKASRSSAAIVDLVESMHLLQPGGSPKQRQSSIKRRASIPKSLLKTSDNASLKV